MSAIEKVKSKDLVIFELDNVLYPEKDYLLQVYYLFAQFIEYAELKTAGPILQYMQSEFEAHGTGQLFEKVAHQFGIDEKYRHNFDLLHETARLPLKLLLFQNMLSLMQDLVVDRKKIYLVTSGNPAQQLNKIRQMEWNGLEQYLTVYFSDELNQSKSEIYRKILGDNLLVTEQAVCIGANKNDETESKLCKLAYIDSSEIYN